MIELTIAAVYFRFACKTRNGTEPVGPDAVVNVIVVGRAVLGERLKVIRAAPLLRCDQGDGNRRVRRVEICFSIGVGVESF